MKQVFSKKWKRSSLCLLILILVLLEFNLFVYFGIAKKERNVSGYRKKSQLKAGEEVHYHFSNNIEFGIKTEVPTNLDIEYDKNIENRETYFEIQNINPISLQIRVKRNMKGYGFSDNPNDPEKGEKQLKSDYECIYQLKMNESIDKIKLVFKKDFEYGLDPNIEYSLALYEEDEKSWELLDTEEISDDSGIYLKSSVKDLKADTDYYITIYEVSNITYVWIWGSIILAIGVISIVIAITKTDFIQYLRTRSTPIEKGAHRLTLEEVLENQNRNHIIDLILNEPGIHFNELLRKTKLAAGNLVWHLDILETYKVIGKKRISNYLTYFPYHQKNPISNLNLKLNKSNITLGILKMIEKEPGIWNSIITQRQKVDHKTIHYHIKKLIDLGLVLIKKEGRKKKLYPNLDSDYFNTNNLNTK